MKNKGNYVEIDELLDFDEGKDFVADILAEYDKLIAREISEVFKKYFPFSTINEEKVLKLARMLISEESEKEGKK
jgi:hypothetical protein